MGSDQNCFLLSKNSVSFEEIKKVQAPGQNDCSMKSWNETHYKEQILMCAGGKNFQNASE